VVLEAITDPNVPTLPPHITFEQAKKFTESMLKGDPEEAAVIKQASKQLVESFVTHDR
jgi:pyruvate dehydrogenase (quinone)